MTSPDRDIPMDLNMQFEFTGELWPWRGPAPYHFITIPEGVSSVIRDLSSVLTYGWGVIPVRVRIGETDFSTSLVPKDGGYALPVKDAVRHAEDLTDGDEIDVELTVRSATP